MDPVAEQTSRDDFERLFLAHQSRVFRAAYRVTGNASDAEDVLQTVFLRLLRRPPGEVVMDNPDSYFYRAAVNAALDLVRARRDKPDVPLDEAERQPALDAVSPDRQAESGEIRSWLRSAVSRLHPTAAEMFTLRYFEGLDNPEVARMMDTSQSVVAVTLHRTRSRLQREFHAHWERSK